MQSKSLTISIPLFFFIILAIIITYPIAFNLGTFSPQTLQTDDLLQAWAMRWVIHAILSGPQELTNIATANIFYPYPNSLLFNEHLVPSALIVMPVTLLGGTPLVTTNLGILFSTAISGWGTYLFVTWLTKNRWAGLIAGIAFAIAPFRFNHITQLNLMSTHYIPLCFLYTALLLKKQRWQDLLLLTLFVNLQFTSSINYAQIVALGLGIWGVALLIFYWDKRSYKMVCMLTLLGAITVTVNVPVLQAYLQVSNLMEITRTLGDARVFGASIFNYLLPIHTSLLYVRWLQVPTLFNFEQFNITLRLAAFPGITVLLLALWGSIQSIRKRNQHLLWGLTMILISLVGFVLSFGANENAFGEGLASWANRILPYPYLYQLVPTLQGFRVPLRFALLPTFGLAVLAGLGFSYLVSQLRLQKTQQIGVMAVVGLILFLEHLPAPIAGTSVPYRNAVYEWLHDQPSKSVMIELPYYVRASDSQVFAAGSDLLREYQSVQHWQLLLNGASGFRPKWLEKLGPITDNFPDWKSFDILQQLGVNYIVLHRDQIPTEAWRKIEGLLPAYLSVIEAVHTFPNGDMILQLRPPHCQPHSDQISLDASQFPTLTLINNSSATYFANPNQISTVSTANDKTPFLEPLFLLPGETVTTQLPVEHSETWSITLANLAQSLTPDQPLANQAPPTKLQNLQSQQLDLPLSNDILLQEIILSTPTPVTPCQENKFAFRWQIRVEQTGSVQIRLLDKFSREVITDKSPIIDQISQHRLLIAGSVPPGLYQLEVTLPELRTQPVFIPLTIRPNDIASIEGSLGQFSHGINLVDYTVISPIISSGDGFRFSLTWQNTTPQTAHYTVFTQLLGPDGRVWAQQDNPPKGGWYETPLWMSNESVVDDYVLHLDPEAPSGTYQLIVGWYNSDTLERVLVGDGDFIIVDTFEYKQGQRDAKK